MQNENNSFLKVLDALVLALGCILAFTFLLSFLVCYPLITGKSISFSSEKSKIETVAVIPQESKKIDSLWIAPSASSIPNTEEGKLIAYGQDLIAHTAKYLGPKGIVGQTSNGMNCQNCHQEAGTKPFGNNYGSVASTYPKLRGRSGTMEDIPHRVNDCFQRSLNGEALADDSKEMKAILAYINWLGSNVPKGKEAKGSGIWKLAYLDRPADPIKGQKVYVDQCKVCHGDKGQGMWSDTTNQYTYPPLWGENSYNDKAGLYRLSRFAGYVKANMPQGTTYDNPKLTDEEAWDVAAFVNSQTRPTKDFPQDWPDISKKPADHPFGPFDDNFTEQQHKFGPFGEIESVKKQKAKTSK